MFCLGSAVFIFLSYFRSAVLYFPFFRLSVSIFSPIFCILYVLILCTCFFQLNCLIVPHIFSSSIQLFLGFFQISCDNSQLLILLYITRYTQANLRPLFYYFCSLVVFLFICFNSTSPSYNYISPLISCCCEDIVSQVHQSGRHQ